VISVVDSTASFMVLLRLSVVSMVYAIVVAGCVVALPCGGSTGEDLTVAAPE